MARQSTIKALQVDPRNAYIVSGLKNYSLQPKKNESNVEGWDEAEDDIDNLEDSK